MAGVSEQVDVGELLERLREEVRRSGGDPGGSRPTARPPCRGRAALAGVRRPLLAPTPGLAGGVGTPVKAVLRKLMRWYVEPLAYDQRSFNAALLRVIDGQEERIAQLEAELAELRKR